MCLFSLKCYRIKSYHGLRTKSFTYCVIACVCLQEGAVISECHYTTRVDGTILLLGIITFSTYVCIHALFTTLIRLVQIL